MSADAWLDQDELISDFTRYFEEISGEARPIGERMWKKYADMNDVFSK